MKLCFVLKLAYKKIYKKLYKRYIKVHKLGKEISFQSCGQV